MYSQVAAAHGFNPRIWQRQVGLLEFKASLVYRSSRIARATTIKKLSLRVGVRRQTKQKNASV